ncbi:MAG: hypothetical protein ACREMO_09150, partial [Gemmatimonadales bacterium]
FLSDGLTEALIHELSQVQGLQVISRNGVSPYRGTNVTVDSIAKALKVGILVEGTVAQAGGKLRVDVSLINASTSAEIGSKTLERPREEIFALQDDLAKEVSIFLRQRLGQEIKVQESKEGTRNAKAWEALQQAEELAKDADTLLASGDTSAAAGRFSQADSALARVEVLDPNWPKPIVLRAWLAYRQTDLIAGFDKTYYSSWLGNGLDHTARALKLNPKDPAALEIRGTLEYWRWVLNLEPDPAQAAKLLASAENNLRAAIAGDSTAAFAWTELSWLLLNQARTAEAKLAALRAYQADPYLSTVKQTLWRLFQSSLDLEDRQEANHWCAEGYRRFPQYYRFTECQLWSFALKGQPPNIPRAWQLLDDYLRVIPSPSQWPYSEHYGQMLVAIALARAGLRDSAHHVAERARADGGVDPTRDVTQLEAAARAILGEKDEALRLLGTWLAVNPEMRASMARDETWWFRDLRSDPRYKGLVGAGPGT